MRILLYKYRIFYMYRTSMQISVALSLTLVFLATVFAGPKPKTYLVETADPEPEHYVSI